MPRAPQTHVNQIKEAAVEALRTQGPLNIASLVDLVLPHIVIAFPNISSTQQRFRGRRVLERFLFNVHDTRFRLVGAGGQFAFNPTGVNSTPSVAPNTLVRVSNSTAEVFLRASDAYQFAIAHVHRTRPTPPKDHSVRSAVHACLRCNCDAKTWVYGFEWRCVAQTRPPNTLLEALGMFDLII
jgi:hypothetical protein